MSTNQFHLYNATFLNRSLLTVLLPRSVFIMNFFPISRVGLTPASFNWNILIVSCILRRIFRVALQLTLHFQFGAVVIIAAVYFIIHGRKVYAGPVAYVRKDI